MLLSILRNPLARLIWHRRLGHSYKEVVARPYQLLCDSTFVHVAVLHMRLVARLKQNDVTTPVHGTLRRWLYEV